LAPLLVIAGRLDMAVGRWAEPGVGIGGGQRDRVQPVDLVAIGDTLALGIEIHPVAAFALARDSRQAVVDIADLRHGFPRPVSPRSTHRRALRSGTKPPDGG